MVPERVVCSAFPFLLSPPAGVAHADYAQVESSSTAPSFSLAPTHFSLIDSAAIDAEALLPTYRVKQTGCTERLERKRESTGYTIELHYCLQRRRIARRGRYAT